MVFKFDEENTGKVYWFRFGGNMTDEDAEELVLSRLEEEVISGDGDVPGTEERYGVHDIDYGEGEIGYTSYAVTDEKMPELMEIFRNWFVANGFDPTPIEVSVRENVYNG